MAYSQKEREDIINRICKHISEEKKSLRSALLLDNMPDKNQFYKWIRDNESFREQYAYACEERADAVFEEILEISDDNTDCTLIDENGNTRIDHAAVQLKRLQVDSRKWMLSKMNPKKYSDKIQVDSTVFKEQPLFPE